MSAMHPATDAIPAVCPGAARQCADPLHCHAHGCLLGRRDVEDHEATGGACRACDGDGRDRYSDYLFECEHCGGTGREEW